MFEKLQALSIFNLEIGKQSSAHAFKSTTEWKECISSVAKACDVPCDHLEMQLEDVRPRALPLVSAADPNKNAWSEVVAKINSHVAVAKSHPTNVLQEGLLLYFLFGISSSGVEQGFAKT